MKNSIELFAVAENEAKNFACNAVVLDQCVVIPSGTPKLSAQLEQLGFEVYACEMDEYIKAGGACKCLTLRMD
jgi:N-dimethylarginine dimethylaminohydrolase